MDLSILDKIVENAKIYPEMEKVKEILSQNGVDFKNRTVNFEQIKKYHKQTSPNGIIMPDAQTILVKVCLALLLFPQRENGKINYLFGKGIGVEIALMGDCIGREKSDVAFEPRSHSDFELYDTKEQRENDKVYTDEFHDIFGGQEIYPATRTKGLTNIPAHYMDKTYQVVDFYGIEVLVPQLEILFMDKFIKQESTPRDEGVDAELLAKKYKMDQELTEKIFNKFYKVEALENIKRTIPLTFEEFVEKVEELVSKISVKTINYYVTHKNPKVNISQCGIPLRSLVEIIDGDIVDGKITEQYIEKIKISYNKFITALYKTQIDDIEDAVKDIVDNAYCSAQTY